MPYRPLKVDGTLIVATGLKEWLRARGLFLECFCPLVFGISDRESSSCRIVVSLGGDVFAFCNKDALVTGNNGCQMNGMIIILNSQESVLTNT